MKPFLGTDRRSLPAIHEFIREEEDCFIARCGCRIPKADLIDAEDAKRPTCAACRECRGGGK